MKKVNILKNNVFHAESGPFATDEDMQTWIDAGVLNNWWGLPDHQELDEEGKPFGDIIPAEYSIEIVDITAQVEQERINKESLDYLASTDWYVVRYSEQGTAIPQEVIARRNLARSKVIR